MSSSSLISNIQFETALLDVFANSNREDKKEGEERSRNSGSTTDSESLKRAAQKI